MDDYAKKKADAIKSHANTLDIKTNLESDIKNWTKKLRDEASNIEKSAQGFESYSDRVIELEKFYIATAGDIVDLTKKKEKA